MFIVWICAKFVIFLDEEQKNERNWRIEEIDHDNLELNTVSSSKLLDIPCTSNGIYVPKPFYRPPATSDSCSSESIEHNSSEKTEILVSKMFRSIYDEKEYIKYLRLLISHLSSHKESYHDRRLQEENLPNSIPDVYHQRRATKTKGKKSTNTVTKSNKNRAFETILDVKQLECSSIPSNFNGGRTLRINTRDTLLQEIQSNFRNIEKRNVLI